MKSLSSETEDSYGMAISAGRIRKFLTDNQITVPATKPGHQTLSAEQVAGKLKPATVCVLSIR